MASRAPIADIFVDFFKNWPWAYGDSIMIVFSAIIIIAIIWVIMVLTVGFIVDKDTYLPPFEVPADTAAITLSKDQFWIKIYHRFWGSYPRDICTYVKRSIFMTAFFLVTGAGVLLTLISAIPVVSWILWGLSWLMLEIPGFSAVILKGIAQGVGYAVSVPITYKLLAALAGLILLVLFFRSQTWRIAKLWIKSKKEKYCLPIRVE